MKHTRIAALALCLVAIVAPAPAQDAPPTLHTFSASYAIDPLAKGKATPVVSYRLNTFHDLLGKKGFDADFQALTTLGGTIGVGTALTHTFGFSLNLSKEFRPKVQLSIGPWLNYQPGQKLQKVRGGLFLGVGGTF